MTSYLSQFVQQFKNNGKLVEECGPEILGKIESIDQLFLPQVTTNDMQKFYEDLGCPFIHSLTREQIFELAELQKDIWKLHLKHRLLLILKSQKIGIRVYF